MPIRKATFHAATHDTHIQRASAYHQHRFDDITGGEHDLNGEPHAVIHAIPEQSLEDDWDENKIESMQTHRLHAFSRDLTGYEERPTGRRAFKEGEAEYRSYGHLATTGVYEVVSRRFITAASEVSNNPEYAGDELAGATTAFVYWLNNQYETAGFNDYTLHVSLVNMDGVQLVDSEDLSATSSPDDDAVFETDMVNPLPVSPDMSTDNHGQAYNDLQPLFERLWSAAGVFESPYNRHGRAMANAAEAYRL